MAISLQLERDMVHHKTSYFLSEYMHLHNFSQTIPIAKQADSLLYCWNELFNGLKVLKVANCSESNTTECTSMSLLFNTIGLEKWMWSLLE